MSHLLAFIEFFRFLKHARERAERRWEREADERAQERAHQRAMLETIFTKMAEAQRTSSDSIHALAEAQQAQARVMQTWLDGFRLADPTPTPPSVVRPEDEWLREQLRLDALGIGDASMELPPEFQLAYELAQREGGDPDFDREGSDF